MIRISRSKAIFILIVGVVFVVFAVVISFFNRSKDSISCNNFRKFIERADCGYLGSDANTSSQVVLGVIQKKEAIKDNYLLTFATKNNKDEVITEELIFPPNDIKVYVEPYGPDKRNSKEQTRSEVYDSLKKDQDMAITILVPIEEELRRIKEVTKHAKFTECFDYNRAFLKYLRDATFLNWLQKTYSQLSTGCKITVLQMQK